MRCLAVPDWKMNCDLPCIADCALEPLYMAGYYFDKHACTCKMAKYINPAYNVPQNKPVFDTMAACMATCGTCHRERLNAQEVEVDTCRCKDALTQRELANPWAVDVGYPGKELCDAAPGCNAALILEGMETARPPSSPPPRSPPHRRAESFSFARLVLARSAAAGGRGRAQGHERSWAMTGLMFAGYAFGLVMCFLGLAIICDDFLVPALGRGVHQSACDRGATKS